MIASSLTLALALATLTGAPAPDDALAARFARRPVRIAGHELPITARTDGLVVRVPTPVADLPRLVDEVRHGVARGLPGLARIEAVRADLHVVWLEDDADRDDVVALAAALLARREIDAVFPLTTRTGDGWGVLADRLVVSARPGTLDAVVARLSSRGLTLVRRARVPDTALFTVGAAWGFDAVTASMGLRDDDVRAFDPEVLQPLEVKATVGDPLHGGQWHLHREGGVPVPGSGQIFAHDAWDVTFGDPSVLVGVVDTGIDVDHDDLSALYVGGFDAITNDSDPRPGCSASPDGAGAVSSCPASTPYRDSHGTSVAGTILATADNDIGVAGVCPSCSLYGVRFIGGVTGSSLTTAEVFVRAADDGVWILNNSWGPGTGLFLPLGQAERDAYDYARTEGRDGLGMVIVFAAGNETSNVFENPYASHPYTIAVAASTNLDDWASYSNYGREIDVAAPSRGGTVSADDYGISTTDVTGAEGYDSTDYAPDFGGTSAASPVVAGVAGLILSVNPSLTAEQVRLVLAGSADKITASVVDWENIIGDDLESIFAYDENGHSIGFGYGRVNAREAVLLATTFGAQGGPCTDDCASCAPDDSCELACEEQADCVAGTICSDGACRSPRPDPLAVGQLCQPECEYCTPALNTSYTVDAVCTESCTSEDDCPTGFDCRPIDADGTSVCAVGATNVGMRNFYRNCRFSEVVFDEKGKGYCSEMCFGSATGDCPYGFHCAPVDCECGLTSQFGCFQYNCYESVFGGNWDYDVCVPNAGYGVTCTGDIDCGPGDYCAPDGTCRLDDRGGCSVCSACADDSDCSPHELCLQNDGGAYCTRGCEADADCPGGSVCGEYLTFGGRTRKTCRAPGDVPATPTCDASFTCVVGCRDDIPCADGQVCEDGACVDAPESVDAGGDGDGDGDGDDDDDTTLGPALFAPDGCGCASGGDASPLVAFALALLVRRRKRV